MGIDRISIGLALKKILQKGTPRDVLSAARLLLANMGEVTDAASTKINVNQHLEVPTLIMAGESQEDADRLFGAGRHTRTCPNCQLLLRRLILRP